MGANRMKGAESIAAAVTRAALVFCRHITTDAENLAAPIAFRIPNVHFWHIASVLCDAEFGRYRRMADIDQAAPSSIHEYAP